MVVVEVVCWYWWYIYTPFLAGYKDPFNSYGGFTEFSQTGGYSPNDIANMRARGISPIRAAYANAERELGREVDHYRVDIHLIWLLLR